MKVPISKQLVDALLLPCIAIGVVGFYVLMTKGQITVLFFFNIPAILFAIPLLDKKTTFKNNSKVPKSKRLFKLPFSSSIMFPVFMLSLLLLVAEMVMTFKDNNITGGMPVLLASLLVVVLIVISIEHPKIWFSDTINTADMIELFKSQTLPQSSTYHNGIFSYGYDWFTIRLAKETKTISWDEITLIKAYKRDLLTTDCIVIDIHLKDTFISINDQTEGHMKFMETAAQHLRRFKKDWFTVVAFPAFETNATIIYKKADDGKA